MKNETNFFRNLFFIFTSISILFSIFVFRTEFELSFLMLFLSGMIFLLFFFLMTNFFNEWKTKRKKILGMPTLLLFYFIIAIFLTFRLFYLNLNVEEEWQRMSGCSLSFHFFLGILAAIISWYSGINELANK